MPQIQKILDFNSLLHSKRPFSLSPALISLLMADIVLQESTNAITVHIEEMITIRFAIYISSL